MSYTFISHKQFYFVVSSLKIINHRNPDNNLESPCKLKLTNLEIESDSV
jgi:hypothetical protein